MELKNFNKFKYNKFNPSVNEWSNSIYSFNKNNLNILWSNKITFDLINNYFNMKANNTSKLKKIYKNLSLTRIRKNFSLKRIFVSMPEIKTSLNNINILVYIFNKENENFIKKKRLVQLQKMYLKKKLQKKTNNVLSNVNVNFNSTSIENMHVLLPTLNYNNVFNNFNIITYLKSIIKNHYKFITIKKFKFIYNMFLLSKKFKLMLSDKFRLMLSKNFKSYIKYKNNRKYRNYGKYINYIKYKNYIKYRKNKYRNYIKYRNNKYRNSKKPFFFKKMRIILRKRYFMLLLYKRYITKLYFNKLKFNSINLFNLNKILYKLYNKRVNVKVVSLKYLHLDNSLFVEAIVRKLRKRNRKILKVLRKALILPKIPEIDSMFLLRQEKTFSEIAYNLITFNQYINIKNISKIIFESLKNIHVVGIRLEGKGRLTRRLTASRAVFKKAYVGNLKNVYSSSKGLSALTSRGFDGSNINYINLNSYNRNGSYGIKGWQNTV